MSSVEKFNGKKFHTWQTKVKFMLMKKGIWDVIINARDDRASTREQVAQWELKNSKALGIIGENLHDTFVHHIDGCDTSKGAWETLDRTFGATSKGSKIGLLIKFFGLEKDPSNTMSAHLNYYKSLLTQLSGINKVVEDDVKIAVLIKSVSLSDEYSSLVTTLLNIPSPNLVDVEASLLEEENRINRKGESIQIEGAFFTKRHNNFKSKTGQLKNTSKVKCDFCGKSNHTEDRCFIKQKTRALLVGESQQEEAEEEEKVLDEANLIDNNAIDEEWAF